MFPGKTISIIVFVIFIIFCNVQTSKAEGKTSGQNTKESKPVNEKKNTMPQLPKEVIVIGGGIAGLAAARVISKDRSNFTVKVFEAKKERYGGRVWTDKIRNMKARGIDVDLGAIALNVRAKNNPLLELVQSFELQTASLDNPQFVIPWEKKTFSGDDFASIKKEALQIFGQALNESESLEIETSVKDAVDSVLKKIVASSENSPAMEFVKALPTYIMGDYSTKNYRPECRDGGYEKVLLDGMGELVDRLVSGSFDEPPLHMHLNKAVRQIEVDEEDKKVIVRTKDGLQTHADIVVVAVSSSVIAAQDILFEPALPKEYQLACQEIGNSPGNKVIIEFEQAFWPSDFGIFVRAVKSEEERGHLQSWINIHRLIKKPVLTGSLFGAPAIAFGQLTDEEAEKSVLAALIDLFGEDDVKKGGKIVRFQRSNWVSDPLFRGTGTYPKVGVSPKLWDVLAEPLCPYIYFAGEHTNSEDPGTLHGAYNSGVRVGNQILSSLCDVRMEEERLRELERKKKENKTNADDGDDSKDEL